jgi:glyoxylase-like metal-dependent hydrolase (beta-lactamase superfamily II)
MKLLHNFYQVGGPSGTHFFDAASYLLNTEHGLYLIDCGTPEGYEACLKNIRSLGYDPAAIQMIFGTHGHYDHVGAAALFQRDFGCRLHVHEADRAQVEQGDDMKTTAALLYGTTFTPCVVGGTLSDGDKLDFGNIRIEVLHTPGHTMGSLCFVLSLEHMQVLVAGDTLHGGFSEVIGSSEECWKNSLEKLTSRHFDSMVFGHCPPSLLADADTRIMDMKNSFAIYHNPWFKNFTDKYRY